MLGSRLGAGNPAVTETPALTEEVVWSREQLGTWTLEPDGLGVPQAFHLLTM